MLHASDYNWGVYVAGRRSSGGTSILAIPEPLLWTADGRAIDPWFVGNTINILGQPGPGPVKVQATTCQPGQAKPCSVTIGASLAHPGPLLVQSATSGLQEAVEEAQLLGGGIAEITPAWSGSSQEISLVTLPDDVLILDLRGSAAGELYGPSRTGAPELLPSNFGSPDMGRTTSTTRVEASNFPGGDLGQKISAAAAALGESGEIVVSVAGEIRSPVFLCQSCTLQINAPVTLAAPITLANGDTVRGNLEGAPLLAELPGDPSTPTPLIIGNSVSNVKVEDVMAIAPNGKENDILFQCLSCTNVAVTGNLVLNASIASIGSTAAGVDQTPNPQYPNVNSSNESSNIEISGNVGQGAASLVNNGVEVAYSKHITIVANTLERYSSGIQWWGGDACAGTCIGIPNGNGAPGNPRKVSDLTISKNAIYNVAHGCIWGSMGANVIVDGNVAIGAGDTGIDTEGGDNITLSNNDVEEAANFQIAAFWLEQNIKIIGNTLYSPHDGWTPIIEVRNAMETAYDNGPIEILGNKVDCGSLVRPCAMGASGGAVNKIEIRDNTLHDTTINATSNNSNEVLIQGNQVIFDREGDGAFDAIETAGTNEMATAEGLIPAYVEISGNRITFTTEEPEGTCGIAVNQSDYNAAALTDISNNDIRGPMSVAIKTIRDSGNPGIVPIFQIFHNTVEAGTFQRVNKNGSSQVEIYDNHTQGGAPWPPPF